jgi:hypothetical protein
VVERERRETDPLNTVTLAELYVSQGFLKRALTIYRELLLVDPDNTELKSRLVELKHEIDLDEVSARKHSLEHGVSVASDEEATESFDAFSSVVSGNDRTMAAQALLIEPNEDLTKGTVYTLEPDTDEPEAYWLPEEQFDDSFVLIQPGIGNTDESYLKPVQVPGPSEVHTAEAETQRGKTAEALADFISADASSHYGEVAAAYVEEGAVQTLERWLENIRRGR